ncbi:transmembrane protein 182 [Latimeria chalumnae]|uniref:Transmembrane protein 182 n=1 Tax=Latimeria chalumnae TaxID=7897 RepID=H3ASC1_LATCH|nr:PREDICTED: transmembrane protein 182 [Latimeria chalumnae]|eukprot:XP_006000111.1 PREDICTED: transmembrane protein 182 [Latimeria chalumnae]
MKLRVGIFAAGFLGALGVLLFLLAFGTDYWLLATEKCLMPPSDSASDPKDENTSNAVRMGAIFHHEGFFWRCWFNEGLTEDSLLKFWFTNQPSSKYCMHAYLLPFPLTVDASNSTVKETAIIFRGFWSVFMLLGVVTIVVAGFLIICAAPFGNYRLYKAGGGLFITAGIFFTLVVVMYVIWVQMLADLENHIQMQRAKTCSSFTVYVRYGWSFILAPIGIFFSLFAGMIFLLVGRTIQLHRK